MAQQERPKGQASKKVARDRIAEALVPDPAQGPPDAVVLHGWVGNSTDQNLLRLYLTHDLKSFVDVPESEVLHSQQLPDDQGTLVWVPSSLTLTHQTTQSAQVEAQFLSGATTTTHLTGVGGAAAQAAYPQPTPALTILTCFPSRIAPCPTSLIPLCPITQFPPCYVTHFPPCPITHLLPCTLTHVAPCLLTLPFCRTEACGPSLLFECPPTALNICPSRICPSVSIPCQSRPICPSAFGCPSGVACFGPLGGPGNVE